MNFCQFEKDPLENLVIKVSKKKSKKTSTKKTSNSKTNVKNGVFKRTKPKASTKPKAFTKPKASVDKYKLESMIETCVQTRLTEFTQDFQKMIMEKTTILSNGNTNAKIEKDIESLKNEIQKIISKLPNSNVVNKDIHYFRIQQEQIIDQIENLQVDVRQLKQEVVPIVHETIDPWDDGHGNQLSSPRKTTPEPVNKDTTPELKEKTTPELDTTSEPVNKDTTPEPANKDTAPEPVNKETTPEPDTTPEPANKDTTPEPKEDNVPEITTNEITEAHNNIVEEEPVAKAN